MAILFLDLDNTLIDRDEGFRRWARTFLDRMGLAGDDLAWFEAADNGGHRSRPAFLQMVRDRYGLRASVDGLVERFYQDLPGCVPPPDPGSLQALIRARDHGWRLCIVTNGGPVQRAKIETAGLVDLVDGVIISSEVGCEKPDPQVLVLGADACAGHRSRHDWMIGDHPHADVVCAVRASIRSAWITRDRSWTETEFTPTISVASVEQAVGQILTHASDLT